MNKSELKAIRTKLYEAIKEIDLALGESSRADAPKVYDVTLDRLDELEANMQNRGRLSDAGAESNSERLALAQRLTDRGWMGKQARIDGVRGRFWFAPGDPLNRARQ